MPSDFNPDAYLSEIDNQNKGFDPDAYLAEKEPQWSDLPKNIIPNAKDVAKGFAENTGRMVKGYANLPEDVSESTRQLMSGTNPMETPVGQDINAIKESAEGIPQSFMNLGSKKAWIEQPVGNAITAGSVLAGLKSGLVNPEEGMLSKVGKGMENKSASLANDLGEVSGQTVQKINPRVLGEEAQANIRKAGTTPNIADVRSEIGKKLVNDNVVGEFGQDIGDRLQKVNELKNTYGDQVKESLDAIKKFNKSTGEYADVDDALHVQANPILKGVLDTTNELADSARSGLRQTSRFWRETYNSLAKKAEANNGRLNFDDIRSEMKEVGKDMDAGVNTPRYATAKDIYRHLAEIRDQMVNDIAEKAGDPKLATNLVNANRGFSFYEKMSNGLEEAGAGGEVPEKMGKHLVKSTMRGDPFHATGYFGLMKVLNSVEPMMAQKLMKWGKGMQKYGPILESSAKQGAKNLAITNSILKQNDPEYAKEMQ